MLEHLRDAMDNAFDCGYELYLESGHSVRSRYLWYKYRVLAFVYFTALRSV